MTNEDKPLACFSNDTDTVSAFSIDDAAVILKEMYGENTSAIDQIQVVPGDKVFAVWIDDPDVDFLVCKCVSLPRVSPRKTPNGHHPDCEVGHPRKMASEWAREGRGLVCSTEY